MSSAEAAPAASPTAAAAAAASTAAAPAGDFLQQRLAAIAALPPEQRSHDEAGFLHAHAALAVAEESLAALGSPAAGEGHQDLHFSVAALSLLAGLEELCSIGVPLQAALHLHSRSLLALAQQAHALQCRGSDTSAQVALRFYSFVSALLQYLQETGWLRENMPPQERPALADRPNPASVLQDLHSQLFHEVFSRSYELSITLLRLFTPCELPSLEQLQRLWAFLCWQWAAQLACGMGRPSWMASCPGPTPAEAHQLQLQALAAMRRLRPSHPLTARLAAQTKLVNLLQGGPSAANLMRHGLQQAAAAGGPHGSSMFTAELAYGLISTSAPAAGRPPWGRLTLAESVQLLQQGDAALARCKAMLPPVYLTGVRSLRDNPSVLWRRSVVERHQQAGASEWREELLAAEAAPPVTPGQLFKREVKRAGGKCAGCGRLSLELHSCSGCKMVKYCSKECHVKHWPAHKAECKAARAAIAAAAQQQEVQQHAQQAPAARKGGNDN